MNSVIVLVVLAVLTLAFYYYQNSKHKASSEAGTINLDVLARSSAGSNLTPNTGAHAGNNRRGAPAVRGDAGGTNDEEEEEEEDEEDWSHLPRLQRLKKLKEREKRRRRQELEAAEEARRARAETQAEKEKMREEMAAERAELDALREAAEREEKKRQEDEEYAKWVGEIGVEERGELGDEQRRKHERVVEFLTSRARDVATPHTSSEAGGAEAEHGRAKCVMVLQEAARELEIAVPELVATIEQLLKDDVITGVFDDRGKFIFVSEEHFKRVAKFIRLRGRVSVVEVARECNKIITEV